MIANNKITLEVCCGTYHDAVVAKQCGADRIELNSALELGGLTPSYGVFKKALTLDVPIAVMVRPRTAGFYYHQDDFDSMLVDAAWFAQAGASGIVFGFLHEDGTIDVQRTQAMLQVIGNAEPIFHKAFDATPDLEVALQQLIDLGIKRVLTGGGPGMIFDNLDNLTYLQQKFGKKIELLPGGGVRNENVVEILEKTQIKQVHMTAKEMVFDPSTYVTSQNKQQTGHQYTAVSENYLKNIINTINEAADKL